MIFTKEIKHERTRMNTNYSFHRPWPCASLVLVMTNTAACRTAATTGFLAVALGAFGAHGLRTLLTQNGTAPVWETAVFYHLVHAVMLFVLAERKPLAAGPWWCFLAGIVIFSGSLYLLAITGVHWLGAITPVGGVSLLAGWLWLAIQAGWGEDLNVAK
jgi:uncharacterized membrane protein YgdD (TMEM256/DUF423 family)